MQKERRHVDGVQTQLLEVCPGTLSGAGKACQGAVGLQEAMPGIQHAPHCLRDFGAPGPQLNAEAEGIPVLQSPIHDDGVGKLDVIHRTVGRGVVTAIPACATEHPRPQILVHGRGPGILILRIRILAHMSAHIREIAMRQQYVLGLGPHHAGVGVSALQSELLVLSAPGGEVSVSAHVAAGKGTPAREAHECHQAAWMAFAHREHHFVEVLVEAEEGKPGTVPGVAEERDATIAATIATTIHHHHRMSSCCQATCYVSHRRTVAVLETSMEEHADRERFRNARGRIHPVQGHLAAIAQGENFAAVGAALQPRPQLLEAQEQDLQFAYVCIPCGPVHR
mmetsp:Transcript_90414/g.193845  ORF Transcript_90414/g.193845 Transcript_90414/m.193845 type:complete len:338 (+) Transcript_90414:340-1353(+)